jgi:hypothetical protein
MEETEDRVWMHHDFSVQRDGDDYYVMALDMWIEPEEEEILEHNGKMFIAFRQFVQNCKGNDPGYSYYVVPGFIEGEPKKYNPEGRCFEGRETGASKINLIDSEEEKSEIEKKVNEDNSKRLAVAFWS